MKIQPAISYDTPMINCTFENGSSTSLRHVTANCIVRQGDQLILVKRADVAVEPYKWAIPGGFMDRDENIFECVSREVHEETGFLLLSVSLFLIVHLPHRRHEDRQNIDFIFTARAGEKVGEGDHEIETIKWFEIPHIPKPEEMAFDHRLVLDRYFDHLKNPSTLPILDFEY
jgi:8-oxo-dGTP diphosphatase